MRALAPRASEAENLLQFHEVPLRVQTSTAEKLGRPKSGVREGRAPSFQGFASWLGHQPHGLPGLAGFPTRCRPSSVIP